MLDDSQKSGAVNAEGIPDDGPATQFRDAMTDGPPLLSLAVQLVSLALQHLTMSQRFPQSHAPDQPGSPLCP